MFSLRFLLRRLSTRKFPSMVAKVNGKELTFSSISQFLNYLIQVLSASIVFVASTAVECNLRQRFLLREQSRNHCISDIFYLTSHLRNLT